MDKPPKTVEEIRKRLEKKYSDSTELFPDFATIKEIDVIATPSAIINVVTGIGGFPRGRVSEIHGPYSSGKTTLAIEVCVEAQKTVQQATILFVDYEHAFDARYAHQLGLNLNHNFIFAQPEYFEQGAAIVNDFLEEGAVDLVVIDSAAAMTPKAELEGEFDKEGGTQKGLQAALMARFLAVSTKKLKKGKNAALVIINQTRAYIKIGGRPQKNAPTEIPAGGNALKFYSSLRLKLEIIHSEGEDKRGTKGTDQIYTQNRVRVTAIKNKLAPPFMRGTFVIEYGKGINNVASIAELAEARLGLMSGGGFYKYEGATPEMSFSCRGREAFQQKLEENPDLKHEIEAKVLEAIKAEHASALGLTKIKQAGKAKEITGDDTILVLDEPEQDKMDGLPIEDG